MKEYFKPGATVLFQGDSITDAGRDYQNPADLGGGYPQKAAAIYQTLFPESGVRFVNRGVSGNRSADLLARYERDFKALQPDFISILIGINDVWRRYDSNDPTTADQFEENYRTLLEKIKRDLPQAKIMILEPFLLHSLPDRPAWHEDLDEKLQRVRRLAVDYADYFIPLVGIFARLAFHSAPQKLAADGVHPTQLGHSHIAVEYWKELGVL